MTLMILKATSFLVLTILGIRSKNDCQPSLSVLNMQKHKGWFDYLRHILQSLKSSWQRSKDVTSISNQALSSPHQPIDIETKKATHSSSILPIPDNESARLAALREYRILDTLPEQSYNDLTAIAAQICGTPISLISLIDENRQWFKSRHGIDTTETPREQAFCAHAICQPDRILLVPNALEDSRFSNNPLVTGSPNIRFYAGAPLVNSDGLAIGTICVIDHVPHQLTTQQLDVLHALGRQTMAQLELRRKTFDLQRSQQFLQDLNQQLQKHLDHLHQRNAEMINLGKMSDYLQTCLTTQEACNAIPSLLAPLFPGCTGSLVLTHSCGLSSERIGHIVGCETCNYDDLDFFREDSSELQPKLKSCLGCAELHQGIRSTCLVDTARTNKLCLPVTIQGEILGVLLLQETINDALSDDKKLLARTVAEQIALTIANLNLREKLQHQSIRDPLTGLFNRRYLEESFDREITRASRHHYSIGVIMIDIDHFKRINDTYGHNTGDYVLQVISKLLLENVRGSDIVCRYGGEEITIILPELSLDNTYQRAESIRIEIMKLKLHHNAQDLGLLTASLGVAAFPQHGMNCWDIIHAADLALYQSKEAGRNRVTIAV